MPQDGSEDKETTFGFDGNDEDEEAAIGWGDSNTAGDAGYLNFDAKKESGRPRPGLQPK